MGTTQGPTAVAGCRGANQSPNPQLPPGAKAALASFQDHLRRIQDNRRPSGDRRPTWSASSALGVRACTPLTAGGRYDYRNDERCASSNNYANCDDAKGTLESQDNFRKERTQDCLFFSSFHSVLCRLGRVQVRGSALWPFSLSLFRCPNSPLCPLELRVRRVRRNPR